MADAVYAANSVDTVGTKDANATATAQQARASDGEEVKGPDATAEVVAEDAQTEAEAEDARDEIEADGKDGD